MDELGPPVSEGREVRERQKTMTPQDARSLAPSSTDGSPNSSPYPTHHREITPRPLLPMSLNLSLPQARNSASSLLEAVVGPSATPPRPAHPSSHLAQPAGASHPPALQPGPARPAPPSAFHHSGPSGSGSGSMASSLRSTSESSAERIDRPETSGSEWDMVSRSSARAGSGEDEAAVKELQRKVDRRRSQLAPLENELAELEARIRAAEARLALAGQGGQGVAETRTVSPLAVASGGELKASNEAITF